MKERHYHKSPRTITSEQALVSQAVMMLDLMNLVSQDRRLHEACRSSGLSVDFPRRGPITEQVILDIKRQREAKKVDQLQPYRSNIRYHSSR